MKTVKPPLITLLATVFIALFISGGGTYNTLIGRLSNYAGQFAPIFAKPKPVYNSYNYDFTHPNMEPHQLSHVYIRRLVGQNFGIFAPWSHAHMMRVSDIVCIYCADVTDPPDFIIEAALLEVEFQTGYKLPQEPPRRLEWTEVFMPGIATDAVAISLIGFLTWAAFRRREDRDNELTHFPPHELEQHKV